MYCSNCGKQIPDGIKFCTYCGTAVITMEIPNAAEVKAEVAAATEAPAAAAPAPAAPSAHSVPTTPVVPAPEAPAAPAVPAPAAPVAPAVPGVPAYPAASSYAAPASPSGKQKKKSILPLIFGLIAVIGTVVFLIACPEFYHRDKSMITTAISGICFVALLGIFFFCIRKKTKLSVIGGLLSMIAPAVLLVFVFAVFPARIDSAVKEYINLMDHSERALKDNSVSKISTYPYGDMNKLFHSEKKQFNKVTDALDDLYDDGDYSEWVTQSHFVHESLQKPVNQHLGDELWNNGYDVDEYELRGYSVLFEEQSPLGKAHSEEVNRMKSDIDARIKQVEDYYATGSSRVIMVYGDGFRMNNGMLIYNDDHVYVVTDLSTGNYFCTGDRY